MGEPEGLGLIIVFDHAGRLTLKVDSLGAIVFDSIFKMCCNLCTVGLGGVFAIQYRVVVSHGWCIFGEGASV